MKTALLAVLAALLLPLAATAATPAPPAAPVVRTDDGLQYQDEVVGTGVPAKSGQTVTVAYIGTFLNGQVFDRATSFRFTLGKGQVIKGWDEGVAGMNVGGQRKLTIPPSLAYGDQGAGGGVIPPNATLLFEIKLLSVK